MFERLLIERLINIFMLKEKCTKTIIENLIDYLVKKKSIKIINVILNPEDNISIKNKLKINQNEIIKLNNRMYSFYCTKIRKETELLYSSFGKARSFPIDLFIEQSNFL